LAALDATLAGGGLTPSRPAPTLLATVTDLVFFYGTLMSAFKRPSRARINAKLELAGRGSIPAALFDVGIYPAAIPAADSRVLGEVHRMLDRQGVLDALDEIEGFDPGRPDESLYTRVEVPVTFDDGGVAAAWVYFYNAPLGRAQRIPSGDYLEHLKVK
jgi:gamma-glutamylcyclotransferase (GGCT)/AIG2-like uncharacterized protein YtfP